MRRCMFLLPLSVLLCLLVTGGASAAAEEEAAADALHTLGLFQGTGTAPDGSPVYALDRVPTRNQAVIMLVRLLGKEDEARNGTWDLPFRDVPPESLSARYIGYAWANGLVRGTTETTFSGTASITRNQYLLLLLRALGYDGMSLSPAQAAEKAAALGLTDGQENGTFTRGGVALLSYRALDTFLYTVTAEAATLREALGLGASPMIADRAIPVSGVRTGSYQAADAAIRRDADYTVVEAELTVPGGTVVHFAWTGTPHGTMEHLIHILRDGTVYTLPLPQINDWDICVPPEQLSYDAASGLLTYEAVIPRGTGAVAGQPVRRAGRYRYIYDVSAHTCTVTELERFPAAGAEEEAA